MAVPQKIKNRITIWSNNPTSRYILSQIKSRVWKKYLHIHVQSRIVHNSQKVEVTQMSVNGWMDKQNVVYTYNGNLFGLKKKGNSDIWYDMDKPWGHYAKVIVIWAHHKKTNNVEFHWYELPRKVKFMETKSRRLITRDWGGRNGKLMFNEYRTSAFQGEKVLEMACMTIWRYLTLLNCTL